MVSWMGVSLLRLDGRKDLDLGSAESFEGSIPHRMHWLLQDTDLRGNGVQSKGSKFGGTFFGIFLNYIKPKLGHRGMNKEEWEVCRKTPVGKKTRATIHHHWYTTPVDNFSNPKTKAN